MTLQQKLVQADDYLDMLKDKAKETDKLAKENLRLRKKFDRAINVLRKSDRKIERLNNIINKLENESYLGIIENQNNNDYSKGLYTAYKYINDRIKELKGVDKE